MVAIKPLIEPLRIVSRQPDAVTVEAFMAAAYEMHAAGIHGMALGSTRDPELAADVTQDAFLRLMTEVQRGRAPDNVGGWLYRATTNLIISRARRAAVARRFAPRLLRRDAPDQPDHLAIGNEQRTELGDALASLAVADRMVLMLAAQGVSGEEAARQLGRTAGATRVLLLRARKRLRLALAEREERR